MKYLKTKIEYKNTGVGWAEVAREQSEVDQKNVDTFLDNRWAEHMRDLGGVEQTEREGGKITNISISPDKNQKCITTFEVIENKKENELQEILNNHYISRCRVSDKVPENYDMEIIKEFLKYNASYVGSHGLNCKDIEIFLNIQNIFKEKTEESKEPKGGDILELHSNNGYIFHKNAHIEKCSYNATGWTYCESASPHYTSSSDTFSTSGGAWGALDIAKLEYIEQRIKTVWTWGSCGGTGNGGIYIPVLANVFKLQTGEKFVPLVVSRLRRSDYGYKYKIEAWHKLNCAFHCFDNCFKTMAGLKNHLKNRGLRLGADINKGYSKEVIGDYDYIQHMNKKEYDKERGTIAEFPLLDNGSYTTAFFKNGNVHFCNCNVKNRTKLERIHE